MKKKAPVFPLEFAAASDVGRVRDHNEDAVAIAPHCGFAVLADGMGGYNAGEVAAEMATRLLIKSIESSPAAQRQTTDPYQYQPWLQGCIQNTNATIFQASRDNPRYTGMGTTLVSALFHPRFVTVAHIGDSRLYLWRDGNLLQLTRDHSLLQAQIDAGLISSEDALDAAHKNLITRAVGVEPTVIAEMRDVEYQADDIFLLCSDGLTDMAPEQEIGAVLQAESASLDDKAQHLITLANHYGGRDNTSVILIRVLGQRKLAHGEVST
jgi:serine/threonine protein phosphatase PrpC